MSIFTKIKEFFLGKADRVEQSVAVPLPEEPVAVPKDEAIAKLAATIANISPAPSPTVEEVKTETVSAPVEVTAPVAESKPAEPKKPARARSKKPAEPKDPWPFPKTPPQEGKKPAAKPAQEKPATKPAAPKKPRAPKPKQ